MKRKNLLSNLIFVNPSTMLSWPRVETKPINKGTVSIIKLLGFSSYPYQNHLN